MLDVVGVGALNLDYIVGGSVPRDRGRRIPLTPTTRFEHGSEFPADEATVLSLLDALGGEEALVPSLGGSAFLTIHALAEMRLGLRLGYVGVCGRSPAPGFSPMELMAGLGIDNRAVRDQADQTCGICVSHIREGERTLLVWPGANTAFAGYVDEAFDSLAGYMAGARFLHVTSLFDPLSPGRLLALVREAKRRNPELKLSFDPGHAWCVDQPEAAMQLLRLTDYLLVNQREFRALGGLGETASDDAVAEAIVARCGPSCRALVAKRYDRILEFRPGEGGEVTREEYRQQPLGIDHVEDDTGAGDVFASGVLAALTSTRLQFELGAFLGLRMARHKLLSIGDQGYGDFASIAARFLRDWADVLVRGEREAS
jgi:sugar/nucleoside kinase (ribokinase family)